MIYMALDLSRYGDMTPDIVEVGDHFISGAIASISMPMEVKKIRYLGEEPDGFYAELGSTGVNFSFSGEGGCLRPFGFLVKDAKLHKSSRVTRDVNPQIVDALEVYIHKDFREFLEGKYAIESP